MARILHTLGCASLAAAILVAAQLLAGGCSSNGKQEGVGYFEIERRGTLYVLNDFSQLDDLNAGKGLKKSATGFGPQGEKLVFQADDPAMEKRLKIEYELRHGGVRK